MHCVFEHLHLHVQCVPGCSKKILVECTESSTPPNLDAQIFNSIDFIACVSIHRHEEMLIRYGMEFLSTAEIRHSDHLDTILMY